MSDTTLHPGAVLRDALNGLAMSASELARIIRVPPNRISQIIAGKRQISADTALRLGHLFGNGAWYWMDLQTAFDIEVTREAFTPDFQPLAPVADARVPANDNNRNVLPLRRLDATVRSGGQSPED
ncbi:MAG: HigA family addiction module antidote protein [Methylobacteriaceae bacterium]|jgi:addiction module HigA family antidote|nr:HigA family addiction module antidote protein [Methylobacteriaceae bacterium]